MSINELESKIRELRQLQSLIDEAQAEAEAIKDAIKAQMGQEETLRAGEYTVTWKPIKSARIDATAFKNADSSFLICVSTHTRRPSADTRVRDPTLKAGKSALRKREYTVGRLIPKICAVSAGE